MRSRNLPYLFLKFLMKNNNPFDYTNVKEFLLKYFPEEPSFRDRIKMKDFLNSMNAVGYIEENGLKRNGIGVVKIGDDNINRDRISAYVKVTAKGVDYYNQERPAVFEILLKLLSLVKGFMF